MENVIKSEETDETSGEHDFIFMLESFNVTTMMEILKTELDISALDIETDNQQSMKISSDLDEKREERLKGLFAPFSHYMRPDPEYIRLEFERSAYSQEAATNLINDRYKLIVENSIRRKEKDKIKFSEISHVVEKNASETVKLFQYLSPEDVRKTTNLLSNMHITPVTLMKNRSVGGKNTNLLCDVFMGYEDFEISDTDENEIVGPFF